MPFITSSLVETLSASKQKGEVCPFMIGYENLLRYLLERPKLRAQVENKFLKAPSTTERVASVTPLLQYMTGCDPFKTQPEKSTEKSKQLREEGNKLFQQKDYTTAVERYSASVATAPESDAANSLALAYANRAVTLLKGLGDCAGCVVDTLRALELGYPENLRHKLHHRLSESYRALGDRDKAETHRVAALADLEKAGFSATELAAKKLQYDEELGGEMPRVAQQTTEETPSTDPRCYTLQGERNKEVPAASDAVELCCTGAGERLLVTTRNIEPGEVLIVEEPYIDILSWHLQYKRCEYCYKTCNTLLPCPTCAQVMFCSEACRETAAREYHEWECPFFPATRLVNPGSITMMTLRLIAKEGLDKITAMLENPPTKSDLRSFDFDENGQFVSSDFHHVFFYDTKFKDSPEFEQFGRAIVANYLSQILKINNKPKYRKMTGFLMQLAQVLAYYSADFEIRTDEKPILPDYVAVLLVYVLKNYVYGRNYLGTALYPTMNLLKHSCDPNVYLIHRIKTAIAVAIKPIPKGTPLTLSYKYNDHTFVDEPKKKRQHFLSTQFYIDCMCEACVGEWEIFSELPNVFPLDHRNVQAPELVQASITYMKYFEDIDYLPTRSMDSVWREDYEGAMRVMEVLDRHGHRLSKEYCVCQQIMKLYLDKNGNNETPHNWKSPQLDKLMPMNIVMQPRSKLQQMNVFQMFQ